MFSGIGDVGLPWCAARTNAIGIHPALHRHVRVVQLIVETAVYRHEDGATWQRRRLDRAVARGRCSERLSTFNLPEPRPRREVSDERSALGEFIARAADAAEMFAAEGIDKVMTTYNPGATDPD